MKLLLLCLLLLPQSLWAATTASLDRSEIAWGESVRLTLQSDEDASPDLTVLRQDFELLNQTKRSQTTISNGSMQRQVFWVIDLMPKHQGRLPIPAIPFGKSQTKPLILTILAQQTSLNTQGKDILLLASAQPMKVSVQAQILFTVKLMSAVNLAQVSMPALSMPDTMIQQVGQDKKYEATHEGKRYVVLEQQYALFPQQSGILHVPALQLDARKVTGQSMFRTTSAAVRVFSEPFDIEVVAAPEAWDKNLPWLPAKQVMMREIWADTQGDFKVGEPFTRTIEIKAEGLMAAQLPALLKSVNAQYFKQYPDQAELTTETYVGGILGVRREKTVFIPMQAGDLTLPGIAISWWDSQRKTVEHVQIPDRVITVLPADKLASAQPPAVVAPMPLQVGEEVRVASEAADDVQIWWQLLAVIFALAWLLTVFLWWLFAREARLKQGEGKASAKESAAVRRQDVLRKMKQACQAHDAHQAAKLLPLWGVVSLNDAAIQSLAELQGRTRELDAALLDLTAYLYAKQAQESWSGDALHAAMTSLLDEQARKTQHTKNARLMGLYS